MITIEKQTKLLIRRDGVGMIWIAEEDAKELLERLREVFSGHEGGDSRIACLWRYCRLNNSWGPECNPSVPYFKYLATCPDCGKKTTTIEY